MPRGRRSPQRAVQGRPSHKERGVSVARTRKLALPLAVAAIAAIAAPAQAAFPGANGKVVFESVRDGNPEIYTMDANGSNVNRLTNNAAIDESPVVSPDGSKVAFVSLRDGNFEIYSMSID